MNNSRYLLEEDNMSVAWAKAFLRIMEPGIVSITPLIVTLNGFDNGFVREDPDIRNKLEQTLERSGKPNCATVANTLFPGSLWNKNLARSNLYSRYLRAYPRIKRCRANYRGTYFHRLIAYEKEKGNSVNQIEHVINTWLLDNHRHSALQASIFDPRKDHTNSRQQGFPCLQQIAINPLGTNGSDGLTVTGIYALQHIFEKAYGNYLGLCRLSLFMAHEMGLELKKVTCIATVAKLGYQNKTILKSFENYLTNNLASNA